MTSYEKALLYDWLKAGVGKKIKGEARPHLLTKGYLEDHGEGVYSLTERGKEHAERRR